MSTEDCRLER